MAIRNQTMQPINSGQSVGRTLWDTIKVPVTIALFAFLSFYVLHNWLGWFGGKTSAVSTPVPAATSASIGDKLFGSAPSSTYAAGSKFVIHQDNKEAVITVNQINGSKAMVTTVNGDTFECSVRSLGNPTTMQKECTMKSVGSVPSLDEKFSKDYIDYASSPGVVCPIVAKRQATINAYGSKSEGSMVLDKSVTCAEVMSAARQMMERHNEGN